jgi:hypothetical protein
MKDELDRFRKIRNTVQVCQIQLNNLNLELFACKALLCDFSLREIV